MPSIRIISIRIGLAIALAATAALAGVAAEHQAASAGHAAVTGAFTRPAGIQDCCE